MTYVRSKRRKTIKLFRKYLSGEGELEPGQIKALQRLTEEKNATRTEALPEMDREAE